MITIFFLSLFSIVIFCYINVKHNQLSCPEQDCMIQVKNPGVRGAQYTPAFEHYYDAISIKSDLRNKI